MDIPAVIRRPTQKLEFLFIFQKESCASAAAVTTYHDVGLKESHFRLLVSSNVMLAKSRWLSCFIKGGDEAVHIHLMHPFIAIMIS
jgi:hypothetical protein